MRCTAGAGNLRRRAGGGEMPGEFLSQHARKNRRGTPRTACRLARGGTTAAPQLPVPLPCRNRRTRTVRGAAIVGAHSESPPFSGRGSRSPPGQAFKRALTQHCVTFGGAPFALLRCSACDLRASPAPAACGACRQRLRVSFFFFCAVAKKASAFLFRLPRRRHPLFLPLCPVPQAAASTTSSSLAAAPAATLRRSRLGSSASRCVRARRSRASTRCACSAPRAFATPARAARRLLTRLSHAFRKRRRCASSRAARWAARA